MTLNEFLDGFDHPGAIVLLEGKRTVLEQDKQQLVALGKLLAEKSQHIKFRSGNASGADEYFSIGVSSVDAKRLEVITPYTDHRKKQNVAHDTYSLEHINFTIDDPVVYQSKSNKKTEKLIDKYVAGARDRFSIKAAYIIRDTVKVLGTNELSKATFGLFYDDLNEPQTGGTGHTMNVCELNQVPLANQMVWMEWLKN